jgi:hypothetical protein
VTRALSTVSVHSNWTRSSSVMRFVANGSLASWSTKRPVMITGTLNELLRFGRFQLHGDEASRFRNMAVHVVSSCWLVKVDSICVTLLNQQHRPQTWNFKISASSGFAHVHGVNLSLSRPCRPLRPIVLWDEDSTFPTPSVHRW